MCHKEIPFVVNLTWKPSLNVVTWGGGAWALPLLLVVHARSKNPFVSQTLEYFVKYFGTIIILGGVTSNVCGPCWWSKLEWTCFTPSSSTPLQPSLSKNRNLGEGGRWGDDLIILWGRTHQKSYIHLIKNKLWTVELGKPAHNVGWNTWYRL